MADDRYYTYYQEAHRMAESDDGDDGESERSEEDPLADDQKALVAALAQVRPHELRELIAILRQVRNAGFDVSTVEGQNRFRKVMEFGDRNVKRCETAAGELTKYGIMVIAATVVGLMVRGFWAKLGGG